MMPTVRFLVVLSASFLLATSPCLADVITFDDINTGTSGSDVLVPISSGYHGFNWSNFGAIFALSHAPISGYAAGLISPPNEAFNEGGTPANFSSTTPFTFASGYFTGAWNEGLNITIQGFTGATLVDSTTIVVSSTAPTLETFNWAGLTEVTFNSFGGTPNPTYAPHGSGTQFALDNLTVNTVPEPGALPLVGVAGGLILLSRKRFR